MSHYDEQPDLIEEIEEPVDEERECAEFAEYNRLKAKYGNPFAY